MLDAPLSGLPRLKNEASLEAFHWLRDSYVAPYSPAAFSALLVSLWPSPDLGGVEISFFITAVLVTRVWNCKGSICQDGILAYLTITWLRCKSQLFYNSRTGHLGLTRQIRTPVLRIPPAVTSQAKMKNWLHECQKWVSHMIGQYVHI